MVYSFMTDKCKRKMPEAYFLLLKEEIFPSVFELSAVLAGYKRARYRATVCSLLSYNT